MILYERFVMAPKWGRGPDSPLSDGERVFWKWLAVIFAVAWVALMVKCLVDGIPFVTLMGTAVLFWGIGKWLAPNIKRLDTDYYPQGNTFERASPSLSEQTGWAALGSSSM